MHVLCVSYYAGLMFLKKLEISGFKSFAAKTTLDFSYGEGSGKSRGVTAVVGPNGSGKSNIADALRWVMGEQSMKNLRGRKSEDIIFAGSGKKARLGSARVVLYLDNSDKKLPLDFDEVSISRKMFRSGESEYLVNNSRVRLQDITDLLAKAGVGKESYAIINQGMADSILSSSPVERRIVIEDAAGVKQYQIKKERSLRKLDSTRENLAKVKGIIEEIGPHIKTLKRQADKAAKGEEVAASLREKQTQLFSYLWKNFESEKNKLNREKDDLGIRMMNIQREADKLGDELAGEAKRGKDNDDLAKLEGLQREAKTRLGQLDRDLIVTEGRIEIEKEKQESRKIIEEIKIHSIPVDLQYVRSGIEEIKRDQETLIKKMENAEKLEDLQDIKEFATVIRQKLHDLRSDIEKGKRETKIENEQPGKEVQTEELRKKAEDNSKIIRQFQEKTAYLREEIKKTEESIKETEKKIEAEIALDKKRRQKFFELEHELRVRKGEVDKFKDIFNESKIALARLEVREEDIRNQIKENLRTDPEKLEPIKGEIDPGQLDQEIRRLKTQIEQIGGIDPLVVEEYEETSKRFEFLTNESQDLERAIASLREVIKEMEQKISQSFEKTFTEINKEFTKYFRIIFGGGNAHLSKIKPQSYRIKAKIAEESGEEEDLEETEEEKEEMGIDIYACPPGKKISSLAMLSGGERSLASLALLFAIISHNPPPFSVLDEVEAALDEANSKRFSRIITELSSGTQFIIITHNRETMRQASMLYGVTMGEDGISKMLSVHLDQVGQGGKIIK